MSQVTIYLEEKQVSRLKKAAQKSKKSISKWIADAITEKLEPKWSPEMIEAAGTWGDFPEISDLRKQMGKDVPRVDV